MNENAKKWIEALRSGEYEQTQRYLRTDEGHCCLGVACDLFAKETGEGEWAVRPKDAPALRFIVDALGVGECSYLPIPVQEWLGLNEGDGGYLEYDTTSGEVEYKSLADRNDNGADFEEIAEIIERQPERLFTS